MILRRLRVEGWRCFADHVELNGFGDGVNVVHGPNGIGKSTLMLALASALFDGHRTSGSAIKLLRPWGRELNPTVTIEWEHDGERYRLRKRFLTSPLAELSRLENGDYVRLAEGDAADQRARDVLAGAAPGRGVSDQRHWGLAQVLWAPQGGLAVTYLAQTATSAIQSALGAQVSGLGGESVERRVRDAYAEIFTGTGKLRSGQRAPVVVRLEEQLAAEREKRKTIQERFDAYEQASRRIEDLRHLRDHAEREESQLQESLRAARRNANQYQDLAAKQAAQQQAVRAAEQRHLRLKQQIDDIGKARRELAGLQQQLGQLSSDAPAHAQEVEARRIESERAKAELDAVRRQRPLVDAARRKAQLAERLIAAQEILTETDRRLEAVEEARREIGQLRRRRGELAAPDAEALREIAAAVKARDDAQVRLDASMITLHIVPETDLKAEVLSAEETGRQTPLAAGSPRQWKGSPEVAVRLLGIATLRATGPAASADALRRTLAEANERVDTLTAGFGTRDFAELQQLQERRGRLEASISEAAVRLETLLNGGQEEEIRQRRLRTANAIEQILAEAPDWTVQPPNADHLARHADEIQQSFVTAVETAEAVRDKANEALSLIVQKQASREEQRKAAERQVAAVQQRLEELRPDGLDDEARARELDRAALQWHAANAQLAHLAEALREFAGDPRAEAQVMEKQLEAVRRQAAQSCLDLNSEEVRLQQLGSEAPYSALAAVEEKIQQLETAICRERRRNDAIRLLYETINECKRAVIEAVVGPVQRRATQTLHRIAGSRIGAIEFNSSFLPRAVAPGIASESVCLEQLSGGEQEQIHFAVRLALASILFQDQRQLVVLDDAFTYTDTARLARIMTILEEAAERFQIVVLSCHPERYHALPQAEFFDLEKIASGRSL